MVFTSKCGRIQPEIQIWYVQCVDGSRKTKNMSKYAHISEIGIPGYDPLVAHIAILYFQVCEARCRRSHLSISIPLSPLSLCLNNSLAQVSTATLFAQVFLVKLVFGSRQDTNPIILWYCTGGAPAPDPARAHTKWKPNTFPFSLLKTFSNFWFCGVKVGAESVTNVILSRSLN